jgi:DeoR/GlpR family transcriptional regulator of sugar metabolism
MADINRTPEQQAKRKIAVTDHSKLGVVAKWLICDVDQIDDHRHVRERRNDRAIPAARAQSLQGMNLFTV